MFADLHNKVIFIAGAGGLLGKEFTKACLNQGASIVAADISETALSQLQAELTHPLLSTTTVNISESDSIQKSIEFAIKKHKKIDAFVNTTYPRNKSYGTSLEKVTYSDFCENVNLQLGGYFLSMQQFSLFFKKQGYGNLINIASIYGVIPPRFDIYEGSDVTMPVEYAAVKSALIHLTKYFVHFYAGSNIRYNCISPGGIQNNHSELFCNNYKKYARSKGMLDPADISGSLLFLLSDDSAYINGQNLIVDDGWAG